MSIEARHLTLIEVLARYDVEFVLVGGVALQLHGYSGSTKDVDVTIAVDGANGERVEAALTALNAQPDLPGARGSSYRTSFGRIEVMRSTAGPGDYHGWMKNAVQIEVSPGVLVWVGGAPDLVLSKEQAGRKKDLDTLPRIRTDLLANRRAKTLTTRADLDNSWRETADRFGFGPAEAAQLPSRDDELPPATRTLPERIERALTTQRAVFEPKDLRAAALEQSVGELDPDQALATSRDLLRERRVLPLEDGKLTTLAARAQEQAIERHAAKLAEPGGRDVGETARATATREVAERLGAPLSDEQQLALLVLTGPERAAALIGPAGAGKGVVIDAATRAEQLAGRTTIGVAVAGATRERLEHDSPALENNTFTLDSLVARARSGSFRLDSDTAVFFDEAGMADNDRLQRLLQTVEEAGAKLIAVGDGKQLPAIGPGGMFDRLTERMPVVELEDVRRTLDPDEQRAWAALRNGQPEIALAHYHHRKQLHLAGDRDLAAEAAVQQWAELTETHDPSQIALIADGPNIEIDRLNARAQHLRHQRGELGEHEIPLPDVHYGLREHDCIAFIRQHRIPNERRVENGTRGEITNIAPDHTLTIRLDGTHRTITLHPADHDALRLAYAQHIYRQQGATVERAVVLTGGWQTSKESAYVQATRARHGTDWHLARDELGTDGTDPDRIERLAQKMRTTTAHTPSVHYRELDDPDEHMDPSTHLRTHDLPTNHTELTAPERDHELADEMELSR